MITVENLRKLYGEFVAVDEISFEIKKGEIVGFLGPNGAGKTTTMRCLTGFMPATAGTVVLNGSDVFEDPDGVKRSIGYLPESAPLYLDMKVEEYLDFIADVRKIPRSQKRKRIKEVAESTGLSARLRQEIGHLSKGYRQRVGLAQAMIHNPEILILDEPTSGLDPNQIVEIRNLIKEIGKNKTIIFSTHILSEAEATCDRVIILNRGRIVASGTSQELRSRHKDKALIRVKIEGTGKGLPKKLQTIDGVVGVMQMDRGVEKGFSLFEVETASDKDLRKEVTQAVVGGGFDLVEVQREGKTLEDVFAELTNVDTSAPTS
ncbi:MAG: ATP-binding cassette domain-containing protein [Candidatus Gracilibacteria bacterium]|nr:ATP-binding cassette domain-containing protein [Candidatus Gracilibacteria bacterium]